MKLRQLREFRGGTKIVIPFSYYEEKDRKHQEWKEKVLNMPRDRTRNPMSEYDPNNISGKKLAEIGRWALEGKKIVEEKEMNSKEGDYTNVGMDIILSYWLDMRIDEICERGRI